MNLYGLEQDSFIDKITPFITQDMKNKNKMVQSI